MKKAPSFSEEFDAMKKNFSKKKEESIRDLEESKKSIMRRIDEHIDKLYRKKNAVKEVKANKKEFKKLRLGVWAKLIRANFWTTVKFVFSMPFIYFMILPGVLMHFFLEVYQHICFRIYGIPLVKPKDHFIFDRAMLPQLNWLEKFNCLYCSYYNCLVSYMQEIVGRTERYWCPIKHAKRMANPHHHYEQFVEYSDAEHLREEWTELRKFKEVK